jgi:hypothetical protein
MEGAGVSSSMQECSSTSSTNKLEKQLSKTTVGSDTSSGEASKLLVTKTKELPAEEVPAGSAQDDHEDESFVSEVVTDELSEYDSLHSELESMIMEEDMLCEAHRLKTVENIESNKDCQTGLKKSEAQSHPDSRETAGLDIEEASSGSSSVNAVGAAKAAADASSRAATDSSKKDVRSSINSRKSSECYAAKVRNERRTIAKKVTKRGRKRRLKQQDSLVGSVVDWSGSEEEVLSRYMACPSEVDGWTAW